MMLRTEWIGTRCSKVEKQALENLACAEARGLSEMLRELIRRAADKQNLWPTEGKPNG